MGMWSWKTARQVLAGSKNPGGVTYWGVKDAVPVGNQSFQESRTTRSAART